MHATTTSLPLFSLTALEQAVLDNTSGTLTSDDRAAAQAGFMSALRGEGFFYLRDFGMEEADWAQLERLTHDVMDAKPAECMCKHGENGLPRGLSPLGSESTAAVLGAGNEVDLCDKWTSLSHEADVPNVWPSPAFRAVWEQYQLRVSSAARRLLAVIGRALALDERDEWHALVAGEQVYRHLRYPDVPSERCASADDAGKAGASVRMAAHNDLDTITLLHQRACANGFVSLQAYVREQWLDVPAIEGTLVVNFGEVLSCLTGGAVRATKHRVLAPPPSLRLGSARTSTVCFFQPHAEFAISPLLDSDFGGHFVGEKDRPFREWLGSALGALTGTSEQALATASEAA